MILSQAATRMEEISPGEHGVSVPAPSGQKLPVGQNRWVGDDDPAGQKLPASQGPLTAERPAKAQYDPAVQSCAAPRFARGQNEPMGQMMGAPLPAGQYVVARQEARIDVVEPLAQ